MSGSNVELTRPGTDVPFRGLITVCLMIACLMQALDTTIANVALPYMQGSVSASYDQITWVLTSYVIASAIFTAPTSWLSSRFGMKNLFMVCLLGFTVTSVLCGMSTSLNELVLCRFFQGMFGAAIMPLSQSTMLDIYPVEKRGQAMSIWGIGVLIGPVMGPPLGGLLTSFYNWRFVFFVNIPFGLFAIVMLALILPRYPKRLNMRFDWLGFAVLSCALAAFQIMIDKGEELDWFSSPTIIACAVLAALGFYLFAVHMMTAKEPFISRATFQDLNFNIGMFTVFTVGMTVLASLALMTPFLQTLAGYPALNAGVLMAPRGIGVMAAMLVTGRISNSVDPRILLFLGFFLLDMSVYMTIGWTTYEPVSYMMETVVLQGIGSGIVFTTLQVVAFYTLPALLRTQGTSLMNLMRNIGSAIGISITSALIDRQSQVEHAVLTQFVTPFARPLQAGDVVSQTLNPMTNSGASALNGMIDFQSQVIAYSDVYKFLLVSSFPAIFLLLWLRKPARAATVAAPPDAIAVD
jgi:DHA2 family multidrug resistance protein